MTKDIFHRGAISRAGGLLLAFLLSACSHNCGEEDPALVAVVNKASDGDVVAIAALYKRYQSEEQIPSLADYWMYRGALAGDPELRSKHVVAYHSRYSPEQRDRELRSLKAMPKTPATVCLISLLEETAGKPHACPP